MRQWVHLDLVLSCNCFELVVIFVDSNPLWEVIQWRQQVMSLWHKSYKQANWGNQTIWHTSDVQITFAARISVHLWKKTDEQLHICVKISWWNYSRDKKFVSKRTECESAISLDFFIANKHSPLQTHFTHEIYSLALKTTRITNLHNSDGYSCLMNWLRRKVIFQCSTRTSTVYSHWIDADRLSTSGCKNTSGNSVHLGRRRSTIHYCAIWARCPWVQFRPTSVKSQSDKKCNGHRPLSGILLICRISNETGGRDHPKLW